MPADQPPNNPLSATLPEADVNLQLGRADDLRAEVFLTIVPPMAIPAGTRLSLAATLTGPESTRATTLPVRLPIRTVSKQTADGTPQVTGTVILTEPAYWTPEVPMLYRIRGELIAEDGAIARLNTTVGLRRFGVRGHSLWLEGRRWVLRGCDSSGLAAMPQREQEPAGHHGMAEVISLGPDGLATASSTAPSWQQFLEEADRHGKPLLICLDPATPVTLVRSTILAMTRHPAVVMVVLPVELLTAAASCKPPAGTLLLAAQVTGSQPPTAASPGIDVHLVRLPPEVVPAEEWRRPLGPPAIAWSVSSHVDRPACDQFQARLATWRMTGDGPPHDWDWAGFLVGGASRE